ncbi:MAG: histidinol-phosphatase [Spirochaetaceae bacterium]|jgi:histidinol-phosphatase (PHP family)|nr:histidinol-phosphatase [Spirochaetaceae bacterium]
MYSCLHTHTSFCDGDGTVDDFCAAAHEKGLVSLGFSAHAPLPKELGVTTNWHLSHDKLAAYMNEVRAAREKWRDKLDIYLGLEVDFIQGYMSPADMFYQDLKLDYIIGSVHCVLPPHAPLNWARTWVGDKLLCIDGSADEFIILLEKGFNGNVDMLVETYYKSLISMCAAGGITILGHADLIKKNNSGARFFTNDDARVVPLIHKLAAAIAAHNIIVEVNTGGMNRGKIDEPYPSQSMLKILQTHDIPAMINADAHICAHLDGNYETACRHLASAGYTGHLIFTGAPPQRRLEPIGMCCG